MRTEPARPAGDLTDRLLPPRAERPPATRLVSPRGIALRLYLTALFVMQSRPPGIMPRNTLPLADPDAPVSWIDLLATTSKPRRYSTARQLKLRQLHDALRRLSSSEVQLARLPNEQRKPIGRYEGFSLLHEAGDGQPYVVPSEESKTLYLPRGLFDNGWIHVLEDTELAFVIMLACLRSRSGNAPVFATSERPACCDSASAVTHTTHTASCPASASSKSTQARTPAAVSATPAAISSPTHPNSTDSNY